MSERGINLILNDYRVSAFDEVHRHLVHPIRVDGSLIFPVCICHTLLLPIPLLHDHSRLTAHDVPSFPAFSLPPPPAIPSKSSLPRSVCSTLDFNTGCIPTGFTLSQSFLFFSRSLYRTMSVNTSADLTSSTPILSCRPPTSSPLHIPSTANLIPLSSLNMKDTSVFSRHSRNNPLYPKKRPSPHGITKSRRSQSPLTLSVVAAAAAAVSRRSPRAAKMESMLQRRRELQLAALRREGILFEDEYREEIRYYMYEMEVC
jgi:hypothetical protein